MIRNVLNIKKIAIFGMAMALGTASCSKDNNGSGSGKTPDPNTTPTPTPTEEAIFNIGYRVAGTGAVADWAMLPLTQSQMKTGEITFEKNGLVLGASRTNEIISSHNGNYVYVLNQGSGLITKYQYTNQKNDKGVSIFYNKVGEIDTRIFGNYTGNLKKVDDNTGLYYFTTVEPVTRRNGREVIFEHLRTNFLVVKIDLANFSFDSKSVKRVQFDNKENVPGVPNLHIIGVQSPVISNGKVYFAVEKGAYDPTKGDYNRGTLIRTQDYNVTTFVLDYPSLENPTTISKEGAKGSSTFSNVFYAPSVIKTENNELYHLAVRQGKIHKITNGAYDTSYELDLKTALGTEAVSVSGMYYAANGIAYVSYAPDASIMAGGIRYQDGKDVWSIARVDLKNKTAIKMNVTEGLWLMFHQSARTLDGKLYMALCPMGKDGNIYIFDPTKADANGFEKGATLKTAGGSVYLGVF